MEENNIDSYKEINDNTFYLFIDKASEDKLDEYIKEIEEEKKMRKYKLERFMKLKDEVRKEKSKMLKEVRELKNKMFKNLQDESNDEDDNFEDEKPKKKKLIKK